MADLIGYFVFLILHQWVKYMCETEHVCAHAQTEQMNDVVICK